MPGLGQRKAARMAQHMRMDAEAEPSRHAGAGNQLVDAVAGEGFAALGDKDRTIPVQAAQSPQLIASNGMRGRLAVLGPADVELMGRKIDGAPIQGARLRNPQPMPVHDKDQRRIPRAPPGAIRALGKNVVRTRVYGRTREARNIVSAARGRAFSGQARAATSSFISPDHLDWYSDVALELWAMAEPTEGVPRKVTEMEPVAVFIRHLVWGPLVFHAGMTNDELPTLKEQCAEILPRAGARLKENGCDWHNVVRVSFMLHKSEKPQSVLDIASAIVPVPLENAEIELVEGYSTPGKLVEIEVTATR